MVFKKATIAFMAQISWAHQTDIPGAIAYSWMARWARELVQDWSGKDTLVLADS